MTCQNKTCTHSAQIRYRDGRYYCWPCFNVRVLMDRYVGKVKAVSQDLVAETAVNGQPNA